MQSLKINVFVSANPTHLINRSVLLIIVTWGVTYSMMNKFYAANPFTLQLTIHMLYRVNKILPQAT